MLCGRCRAPACQSLHAADREGCGRRRSRFTKPDSRVYLTPAFRDLVAGVVVNGPFHPYIPCIRAAMQPREFLIREPIVVNAPMTCVWCARPPTPRDVGHKPMHKSSAPPTSPRMHLAMSSWQVVTA